MSAPALVLHQFRYEQKVFWRSPPAVFFTVMFPVIFLVLFSSLFGDGEIEDLNVTASTYYVPGIITLAVVSATLVNVAMRVVEMRESDLNARAQEIRTREEQVRQQEAGLVSSRYNLSQARFESPFDGIVTRRNIEEGENVVVGTMNNAGTVLLTVADMSIIEAEVEVDETDIPLVQIGQKAKITIDAISGRTFAAHVTEIGNSPIQQTGQAATSAQRTATNFKVTVQLDETAPEIRPGFTCTADISTATKNDVVAVPIQSLTVRELEYDKAGTLVPKLRPAPKSRWSFGRAAPETGPATPTELPVGHTRKEVEGVFVIRDRKATFVPVEVGIAGERYFEVLSGLKEGDRVITGPFDSVKNLFDGDEVRENKPATATTAR